MTKDLNGKVAVIAGSGKSLAALISQPITARHEREHK